ncbi:hypothetical protein ACCO45_005879 [Purpureocillium lilacinum]|uniref:Uncharacterized protein n=1 Tax=Purpureocillium lilacinum TaxID=33203 RepID=A0ACC4DXF6_PURLI
MRSSAAITSGVSAFAAAASALQFQNTPLYSSYSFNALEHLAGNSPYFEPVDNPGRQPDPPRGCSVTRAAYLVRHAAINANDFDYEEYLEPFLEKLGNATKTDWARTELLTRTGKVEAAQLGLSLSYRYPKLRLPKRVWTSTAERTVQSAKGLVRGLELDDDTINVVEVHEGKQAGADSLTPYKSCKGYASDTGSDQQGEYVKAYTAPIVARLNDAVSSQGGGGFNFTTADVMAMQALCGYETVIRGSSPFCSTDLFTPDEWLQYEYGQDIQYHYNAGYGSRVAGAIGFPWLNATLGLLAGAAPRRTSHELHRAWRLLLRWEQQQQLVVIVRLCFCVDALPRPSEPQPQVLPGCFDGPGQSCSADGLQKFLRQREGLFGGYSEICGNTYKNSTDAVTFYTNSNNGTTVGK